MHRSLLLHIAMLLTASESVGCCLLSKFTISPSFQSHHPPRCLTFSRRCPTSGRFYYGNTYILSTHMQVYHPSGMKVSYTPIWWVSVPSSRTTVCLDLTMRRAFLQTNCWLGHFATSMPWSAYRILGNHLTNMIQYLLILICRRENTVLRGELFERSEDKPPRLTVGKNVYVIPNALVADQFKPGPPKSTETSQSSCASAHSEFKIYYSQ